MTTFRYKNFTKRDYECTNVVACRANQCPGIMWERCAKSILDGLTMIEQVAGVEYWGYL